MELLGKLSKKLELESGVSKSGNQWKKLTFVLSLKGKFEKIVAVDTFNDEVIRLIDDTNIGEVIKCNVDATSREYNGKYYTSVTAWTAEIVKDYGNEEVKQDKKKDWLEPQPQEEDTGLPF